MNRPRLKYFIPCDEVRNQQGKFSALGIFDSIFAFVFPATHRRFFLLLGFTGATGDYDVQALFSGPQDQELGKAEGRFRLDLPEQTANMVFCLENFPLPEQGAYRITVFLDGDYLSEHTFRVGPPGPRHERSQEEVAELLKRPDIVKTANADVRCEGCGAVYRFQSHLDPSAHAEPGFLLLPPGEAFVCSACNRSIPLAQVRASLDNLLGIPRQWLGPQPPDGGPPSPPPQVDDQT